MFFRELKWFWTRPYAFPWYCSRCVLVGSPSWLPNRFSKKKHSSLPKIRSLPSFNNFFFLPRLCCPILSNLPSHFYPLCEWKTHPSVPGNHLEFTFMCWKGRPGPAGTAETTHRASWESRENRKGSRETSERFNVLREALHSDRKLKTADKAKSWREREMTDMRNNVYQVGNVQREENLSTLSIRSFEHLLHCYLFILQ